MGKQEIRVADATAYGRAGFVIECRLPDGWVIPAWEEWGYPEFAETFPTREAASAVIASA